MKRVKDYSCRSRLEKLGLTTLQEKRMRDDLIETIKKINKVLKYGRYFINISSRSGNLLLSQISKTKSTKQLDFFS